MVSNLNYQSGDDEMRCIRVEISGVSRVMMKCGVSVSRSQESEGDDEMRCIRVEISGGLLI